ncbi:TrmH family RNA methyltransferase [Chitinibacter sp. S2-10]|uniref:TrmH family RNA methyltransferase n=1 Tax=Chitinibacter sp. S2-10 TaxID=3373597 RepID=UPI0039778A2E
MTMELITSNQNAHYKLAHKLAQSRRERAKTGLMLLDGVHLLAAWLDAGHAVDTVLVSVAGQFKIEITRLLQRLELQQCKRWQLSDALFESISDMPSASGILALVKVPDVPSAQQSGFCLLLDGVQDPGNVGAILRTAYAAGVQQVWLSSACSDIWSPKVLRAGMGAQMVLPCIENADLPQLARQFRGKIAATLLDSNARDLYDCDLRGDLAFVMGSEGQGISPEMAALAQIKILIPMQAGIESLNVGHASAICLYEAMRQNR